MSRLGEQEVGLLGSAQIRNTITSVKESRTLISRKLGVRADGQALVMTEVRVVVVDELPTTLLVNLLSGSGLDVVANDINVLCVLTDQLLENGADDGLHTGGQNDSGDVVLDGPLQERVSASCVRG